MLVWPANADELERVQDELGRTWTPLARLAPDWIAGCVLCCDHGAGAGARGDLCFAAAALYCRHRLEASALVAGPAGTEFVPGLLALREGPLLETAVTMLGRAPELLLVNASGRDHPRRAGLALHLGAHLGIPSIGVTNRPLLARGVWPGDQPGASSRLELDGEWVGSWLRTQAGVRPVAVHAAHQTSPALAVELALATAGSARTPEPLRAARRLARSARSTALKARA